MSQHRAVSARTQSGDEFALTDTTTDSPILPAGQLRDLAAIDPQLVNWVVQQTEIEANFRRTEVTRVNSFIFIESIGAMICGLVIGVVGMLTAAYVGLNGQPVLGGTIATLSLGTLAVAYVLGRRDQPHNDDDGEDDTDDAGAEPKRSAQP